MQIFFIDFHNGKCTFQTNTYFVNKTPSRLHNYLSKRPYVYFSRVFCHELKILFDLTKLNFLRRRCREINNKLDMTLR